MEWLARAQGTNDEPTMLELTEKVLSMMGRPDLRPVVQNIASAEIREQYLDATKARERLGWTPRYGLDEGLRRTIDRYRKFLAAEERKPASRETAKALEGSTS